MKKMMCLGWSHTLMPGDIRWLAMFSSAMLGSLCEISNRGGIKQRINGTPMQRRGLMAPQLMPT